MNLKELTFFWLRFSCNFCLVCMVKFSLYTLKRVLLPCKQVKPGLPYLDIIRLLRDNSPLPIAAYQVPWYIRQWAVSSSIFFFFWESVSSSIDILILPWATNGLILCVLVFKNRSFFFSILSATIVVYEVLKTGRRSWLLLLWFMAFKLLLVPSTIGLVD